MLGVGSVGVRGASAGVCGRKGEEERAKGQKAGGV